MALSKIDVANMLTGATPVANGGTGISSGTSGQFLKFTGSTTLASAVDNQGGITELDTWRITTQFQGDVAPIANNWEREDSDSPINLGTGMSVSSGYWTFPSTGVWEITFVHNYSGAGDNQYIETLISVTTNNSSYSNAAKGWGSAAGNGVYGTSTVKKVVDVTDTSNVKVTFATSSQDGNAYTQCASDQNLTYVIFKRIGDT
jgi:hypothetical protein